MRHLRVPLGGLQVGYKLQIRPRTTLIAKKVFSITAVCRLRENQNSLSGLSTLNSADFIVGTGGCVGCVTIASMVTIFLTPGVPP